MEVFGRKSKASGEAFKVPEIFSSVIRFSSQSFDEAKLRFGKAGIVFEGNYLGSKFKMDASINGSIQFSLGHSSNYPTILIDSASLKRLLYKTQPDAERARQVVTELWRSYENGIHDRMLRKIGEPYGNWGHIENFLNRTNYFERNLQAARIDVEEQKKESLGSRFLSSFRRG